MNDLNRLRWDDADILTHSDLVLRPDPSRTVIRPFIPGDPPGYDKDHPRVRRVADRVLALDQDALDSCVAALMLALADRHRNLKTLLLRRFDEISAQLVGGDSATHEQRLVIGAYFSEEYSYEAAALFNPSIVRRRDAPLLPDGGIRFAMSLRGIGEGHVSSVTFRTGSWSAEQGFTVDPPSHQGVTPVIESSDGEGEDGTVHLTTDDSEDLSELVIFPTTDSQRQGIEDMRLVWFVEDDGTQELYGTYTAYDGRTARSELMHGSDPRRFSMRPLKGAFAGSKGMALFPRRIDGRYVMLGRQDNENIWLLTSDDIYSWDHGEKLIAPEYDWEFIQVGNCGSPIEIDEGWLLLTHGVGLARSYCIGACLLDRHDPSKVLARMSRPLLRPGLKTRDGYVPNVVYSCGGMVHDRTLLLPYGIADTLTSFASVPLADLLAAMD
jgi:predicted GH43/DUF377 family glycosyl hydrolase